MRSPIDTPATNRASLKAAITCITPKIASQNTANAKPPSRGHVVVLDDHEQLDDPVEDPEDPTPDREDQEAEKRVGDEIDADGPSVLEERWWLV